MASIGEFGAIFSSQFHLPFALIVSKSAQSTRQADYDSSRTFAFLLKPGRSENRCIEPHELTQVVLFAKVEEILLYLVTICVIAIPLGVGFEAEGI